MQVKQNLARIEMLAGQMMASLHPRHNNLRLMQRDELLLQNLYKGKLGTKTLFHSRRQTLWFILRLWVVRGK